MAFDTYEESTYLGEPITLLKFVCGTTTLCYTDSTTSVVFGGRTYNPVPFDREALNSSGTMDKTTTRIRLPSDTAIAEMFRVYPPSGVVGVVAYQGHASDTENDFRSVFVGRVLAGNRAESITTLVCEPISTSFRRPGLRRRYQRLCPHALYGDGCKVNKASFTNTTTVAQMLTPGLRFILTSGWQSSYQPTNFINGIFSVTISGETHLRSISAVDNTNIITLSGRVEGLTVGQSVQMILGCDHTTDMCKNVFNNILNYGGQPWIPTQNPLAAVNNYN